MLEDIGDAEIPEKKRFAEWIQYNKVAITVDEQTGSVGRKRSVRNMPTVGEEFGFLVIPSGYPERNHFDAGYQSANNFYLVL